MSLMYWFLWPLLVVVSMGGSGDMICPIAGGTQQILWGRYKKGAPDGEMSKIARQTLVAAYKGSSASEACPSSAKNSLATSSPTERARVGSANEYTFCIVL